MLDITSNNTGSEYAAWIKCGHKKNPLPDGWQRVGKTSQNQNRYYSLASVILYIFIEKKTP